MCSLHNVLKKKKNVLRISEEKKISLAVVRKPFCATMKMLKEVRKCQGHILQQVRIFSFTHLEELIAAALALTEECQGEPPGPVDWLTGRRPPHRPAKHLSSTLT